MPYNTAKSIAAPYLSSQNIEAIKNVTIVVPAAMRAITRHYTIVMLEYS